MGEIVHTSRSRIVREEGPTRRAVIEGFPGAVRYGIHGGIKNFYKVEPKEENPATFDHMVSAIAAWMMGTLATVLARKGIETPEERYSANVAGDIENVGNVPKITSIRVRYHLKVLHDRADEAREAIASYLVYCPAAQSVMGCIDIHDEAAVEELSS
jgi:organic hydroperoxide reductase OsmC/OhrA